ncbi:MULTISPECIES: LuxR C-terminal-related transcriptional regulator [unclassified Kitasatospora]|uniref:LuxR C-terminal-related transcriptional regulator n=1 Tax=unclassified Kitasatospora TaxID=2633591 RepID=UPI000A49C21C|nr:MULTISPECIES: LuxR C-terminal-related transcriptional regulator [unclassified Kitasatospora]
MVLSEAERALYAEVLAQGGRVLFREVAGEDAATVLRLLEIGLLIHHTEGAMLTAVNPRTVTERRAVGLRSAGLHGLRMADEVPDLLGELSRAYDAAPRKVDLSSEVVQVADMEQIRSRLLQIEEDSREETLSAQPGGARPAEFLAFSLERSRRFLDQGGALRTIYQPGARLDGPTVEYAAALTAYGERIRVLDEPFTRLFVFDRRVAVIPAAADNSSAAFVEDPAVVTFLVNRFERDWERAERVSWQAIRQVGEPVHEQVGRMLAQGLSQKKIASRLGLSERTVAGHIARLRELYDAETLFQLGWQMRGAEGGSDG